MITSLVQRSTSRSFLKFFAIILIAQLLTIFVASRLLDFNTNRWIQGKAARAMQIAQKAASGYDWSLIDKIPVDRDTALGARYGKRLSALNNRYFPRMEGGVYLVTLNSGEEFDLSDGDASMSDTTTANRWELQAYKKQRAAYSPDPIVDEWGTYLAAYIPIPRGGKVRGLVATEIDSSPLSDFQSVVRTVFWFSIVPAVLISLVVAYVLASRYVEPMDMFRTIAEAKSGTNAGESGPWNLLTARQRQVAELVKQAKSNKEIADALSLSTETVKQHLKDIKARTGYGRVELAILAAAQSSSSPAPAAT
jgi:DNA-binding CsgD family transcriptional regulator